MWTSPFARTGRRLSIYAQASRKVRPWPMTESKTGSKGLAKHRNGNRIPFPDRGENKEATGALAIQKTKTSPASMRRMLYWLQREISGCDQYFRRPHLSIKEQTPEHLQKSEASKAIIQHKRHPRKAKSPTYIYPPNLWSVGEILPTARSQI
jgi:hypothetical protein